MSKNGGLSIGITALVKIFGSLEILVIKEIKKKRRRLEGFTAFRMNNMYVALMKR